MDHFEIAIVGAGISGLMAATYLAEKGKNSVIFDKGRGPGGRMSRNCPASHEQAARERRCPILHGAGAAGNRIILFTTPFGSNWQLQAQSSVERTRSHIRFIG